MATVAVANAPLDAIGICRHRLRGGPGPQVYSAGAYAAIGVPADAVRLTEGCSEMSGSTVQQLDSAIERFAVPLRTGDGINEPALNDLKRTLTDTARQWRAADVVPKRSAACAFGDAPPCRRRRCPPRRRAWVSAPCVGHLDPLAFDFEAGEQQFEQLLTPAGRPWRARGRTGRVFRSAPDTARPASLLTPVVGTSLCTGP